MLNAAALIWSLRFAACGLRASATGSGLRLAACSPHEQPEEECDEEDGEGRLLNLAFVEDEGLVQCGQGGGSDSGPPIEEQPGGVVGKQQEGERERELEQVDCPIAVAEDGVDKRERVGVKRVLVEWLRRGLAFDNGHGPRVIGLAVNYRPGEERRVRDVGEVGDAQSEAKRKDRKKKPDSRRRPSAGPRARFHGHESMSGRPVCKAGQDLPRSVVPTYGSNVCWLDYGFLRPIISCGRWHSHAVEYD